MFKKTILILVTLTIVGATTLLYYRTRKPAPYLKNVAVPAVSAPIEFTPAVSPSAEAAADKPSVSSVVLSPGPGLDVPVPPVPEAASVGIPPTTPASTRSDHESVPSELIRARELSWSGHHEEAITLYQAVLQRHSEPTVDVQREYARVLGWAGRNEASLRVYDEAAAKAPDHFALASERRAKTAHYAGWDLAAESAYRDWIALESTSVEARSGLAEILERTGRRTEALKLYRELKTELKDQPWIAVKVHKVEQAANAWKVRARFRSREIDSGSRQTDHRERAGTLRFDRSLNDAWSIHAEQEGSVHGFAFFEDVKRSVTGAGAEWAVPGVFGASGAYGRAIYTAAVPDSDLWNARLALKFWDSILPSVEYLKDDVIENSVTLRNGYRRDLYRVRVEARPLRQAFVNARLEHWDITDGNGRDDAFIESVWRAVEGPRQLDLYYRYQTYGYELATVDYFSPDDFHTNEAGLAWRRQLGNAAAGDDPDDHYLFEYAASMDVHSQAAHRLSWTGRLAVGGGWAVEGECFIKIYEHRDIYGENGISVTVNHVLGS